MQTYKVRMICEDGIWHSVTGAPMHLTLEAESFDALVERVSMAAPEMIALNTGYTGPIRLMFMAEYEHIVDTPPLGVAV